MRVLALDTTTRGGSVALVDEERIVVEHAGDPRRAHAERMPGDVLALLREVSVTPAEIDLFAIASGPGSFTGLRIGIATIQGFAFVNRRRIVPVTALDALAHAGSLDLGAGAIVAAWMDGYRRDVFSALYEIGNGALFTAARMTELDPPAVGSPATTLQRWSDLGFRPERFIGDGAVAFADAIGTRSRIVPPPLLAGTIGRIAIDRARAGLAVDPAGVQPLYVRRPDAEVARERQPG